jgi:hypothetical protein
MTPRYDAPNWLRDAELSETDPREVQAAFDAEIDERPEPLSWPWQLATYTVAVLVGVMFWCALAAFVLGVKA